MLERDLQLNLPDGICDAVLIAPESGTLPGIVHLPDIASIREAHRQMARQLAAEGYAVLLPNLFYRTSRPPVWSFERQMGEPRTMQRFAELVGPLTAEAQTSDVAAYADALLAQPRVKQNAIGVVGYCFGGAMALRMAAARPEKVVAAASFHGGNLYKPNDATSPHLLLPQVKARLYFGHAEGDNSMTAEQIEKLEEALTAWGGRFESEVYAGASHGWTVPDNRVFNPPQAERAFEKLSELMQAALQ